MPRYCKEMDVHIVGCGEAFDTALPNTSILVQGSTTLLLDCGYSVPPHVWAAVPDPDLIDALYLSHAHADHYFGVPALLGRWWEDGRQKPLKIVSQPAVISQCKDAMELGYRTLSNHFQYPIEYVPADPSDTLTVGNATLRFAETRHAVPNLAVRIEQDGSTVFYSGDGMFTDASRQLCHRAGLVVHEAYWFEDSPVHADIVRLLEMVSAEQVGHTMMVHVQRHLRLEGSRIRAAMEPYGNRVSMPEPGTRFRLGPSR